MLTTLLLLALSANPQAPRPPQAGLPCVDDTPRVKTCLCSERCVCGCNSGQECRCQSRQTPANPGTPAMPVFAPVYAPAYAPSFGGYSGFGGGFAPSMGGAACPT